jgi:microcystin-dependent protein
MTEPFLGQIQPFGFAFAPRGWAQCNGQILSIAQNTALFSLLGTMYGGNGQTTFALPNLQSRVPMHYGTPPGGPSYSQGEEAGEETITLNLSQMPAHNHTFSGTTAAANSVHPADGAVLALVHHSGGSTPDFYYAPDTTPQPINPASLSLFGGNLPHTNIQPYLTINWCIAMQGVFPSRN